ncbi:MAG: c-type cytochrome [Bacteroidota bacterium]|nr:c-type cytochrome [Bacteroidota bacterium]
MKRITKYFMIPVLMTMLLNACNHKEEHPGWVYMPDMMYSEAYSAYSENPVFEDGKTNQPPVAGTIARGNTPYPYDRSFEGQQNAGKELVNPFDASEEVLARGKQQYQIFCASCHGEQGKGDGHLYTAKLFTARPTSLVDAFVQDKPDGEIYHVITMGSLSGLMGAHGAQISPDDRWKITTYVKNELAQNN